MPPQRYLSNDPNAGAEPPETGQSRYLSTDPNAGGPSPDAGQPNEDKTVAGFLGNAVRSGAEFVGNAVHGARMVGGAANAMLLGPASPDFAATQQLATSLHGAGPRLLQGAQDYLGSRYGSMEALGDTLYTDPVGVAADASTVLTAGGAALGQVPGRVGQVGRAVSAAGSASDPAALAARTAGAVARPLAGGARQVAGMLDNIPQGTTPLSWQDMATGAATGYMTGDPVAAGVMTAGSMALRSPAARHVMASGLRGGAGALTRSSQAASASPEMLTRLAVLAALQGNQGDR